MRTELGSWRRAWRRVGKAEVVEVDADMVEEKLEEEARRRKRRRTRTRRKSALLKSNNPHLAGGEKTTYMGCSMLLPGETFPKLL